MHISPILGKVLNVCKCISRLESILHKFAGLTYQNKTPLFCPVWPCRKNVVSEAVSLHTQEPIRLLTYDAFCLRINCTADTEQL